MKQVTLRPICNARDHKAALEAIEQLWDARPGTPEHDTLEALATLVEQYEKKTFPLGEPAES